MSPADVSNIALPEGFSWDLGDELALLHHANKTASNPVRIGINFNRGALSWRLNHNGGGGALVAKACKVKRGERLLIADLTAGLGRDSAVLASQGAEVIMVERSAALCALIDNALLRAELEAPDLEFIRQMKLQNGDSVQLLEQGAFDHVDVLYLDPMFPDRVKQAAVSKEMATLQALHAWDDQEGSGERLFAAALKRPVSKIVVKRPAKGKPLSEKAPSHSVSSKTLRFDVYYRPQSALPSDD